jgi:predicted esterase YcpF (UPF0227 family)
MIVYLHGLNSSSKSFKARRLTKALAPMQVLAPSYPAHRPARAAQILREMLERILERSGPPAIIGSSMGGFYGRWLVTQVRCAHLFMINPVIRPWVQLRDYAGRAQQTASGERYVLTGEVLEQTRAYAPARPCADLPVPTTLLLDYADDVIDQHCNAAAHCDCARVLGFPDGNHAFVHLEQSLDLIRETLPLCQPPSTSGRPVRR